jgi:hypothetical protein
LNFKKTINHFKHCRIENPENVVNFDFFGNKYELRFSSASFDLGKGAVLSSLSDLSIDQELLVWLSVFFGEDFTEPFQKMDTRNSSNRGNFDVDEKLLQKFLNAASRSINRISPKWKKSLMDDVLRYYVVGLRSGLSMMPLTLGFFGLSMECVGNLVSNQKIKYHTLGGFAFNKLINKRFERHKKNSKNSEDFKRWQKLINSDSAMIHAIRNAVYGHSMLHLQKERKNIVELLRNWLVRGGATKKTANFWFKSDRLELDLQVMAAPLYKVGLRSSRLLIFMLLGFSSSIPFAEDDYLPIGRRIPNEPMKFNDMTITLS